MRVYLGTGGFSNPDWQGLLYPSPRKPSDDLYYYAQAFDVVELNSSFYGIAGDQAFASMLAKSQHRVRMAVKLHQDFTHQRTATAALAQRMQSSPRAFREVGLLAPFLAQFPYSFARTPENRRYVAQLVSWFDGVPLAVEFRHISWHVQEVQDTFVKLGLIWVSVDYPQLAGMPISDLILTSRIGYIRLHGRNEATWWEGKSAAERHDYRYQYDELVIWADRISAKQAWCDELYVLFENTTKGHALHNVPTLRALLRERGCVVDVELDHEPSSLGKRINLKDIKENVMDDLFDDDACSHPWQM